MQSEKNDLVPFNLADFYKTGHPSMYPPKTTKLVANFTPRSDRYAPVLPQLWDHKVVWFGLQGFIQEFLVDLFNREFFNKGKERATYRFQRRMATALGPNVVPRKFLEDLHDLGYLPLEIRSVDEGARVNTKVPPIVLINTHPDFPWVATYFETLLSCECWKPSTVATLAFEYRKLLTYFANLTGAPLDFVGWQGHDFSMRGMSGVHDAARCGAGHLLSFTGTDTIPAIDYLEDHYLADADQEIIGGSIPASEHSVMALRILLTQQHMQADPSNDDLTSRDIRQMAELAVIQKMITEDYPEGMVSVVSDTFDFWNVITFIAPQLKDKILARRPNALGMCKVVFRPDSGDPVRILCGYSDDEVLVVDDSVGTEFLNYRVRKTGELITDAERKGAVECLWDTFGGTTTDKGYRMLDSHVGLIYGDSITLTRGRDILIRLADKGFASSNVVFGIGSFSYNYLTRDTFGWALKATYAEVDGEPVDIYKDPATDDGVKKSARGLLRVELEGTDYVLYEQQTLEQAEQGALVRRFYNGQMCNVQSLEEIRQRLGSSWECPEPGSINWKA